MTTECPCGQPIHGAYLCARCTKALEQAIANISAYWQDLDNVRAKLTRYGGQGGTHGDQLPIDPRFARYVWVEVTATLTSDLDLMRYGRCSDPQCRTQAMHAHPSEPDSRVPDGTALVDAVRNTIDTWVRVVQEQWPIAAERRTQPADTIPACCMYLLGWTDRIRIVEWGPEILDEMDHLESRLRQFVDRPGDKWYAGPCDQCERDLYARTGAAEVTCSDCQLDYDVYARRAWLLERARDHLVNAATLSRAMSWLGGMPLSADRIRQWAKRGRIVARPVDGEALYRIGDALDLLATESQKVG